MPEETGKHEPPTYFANIATMNLNVDEMVIEFRRFFIAHRDFMKPGEELVPLGPPPVGEILKLEPVARVVLSFSAAKNMKQYLDQALPEIEKQRRSS